MANNLNTRWEDGLTWGRASPIASFYVTAFRLVSVVSVVSAGTWNVIPPFKSALLKKRTEPKVKTVTVID